MKLAFAIAICTLALLFSGCITKDEIRSYVMDQDGTISVAVYYTNLTSDQKGEKGKQELENHLRDLEQKRGNEFAKLLKANATDVKVTQLRTASPASALITGRIPSLNGFAAYLNAEDADDKFICKVTSNDRRRGLLCVLTLNSEKEKVQEDVAQSRADSLEETRFALAEGEFTSAQGFIIAKDKCSALLDMDGLAKKLSDGAATITLSLEWELPEAR